jgi:hypothetical protein
MRYAISTDDGNGQPVRGATITFSKNGQVFNAVAFPDNTGILYFDNINDSNLFQSDVSVRVTAPGHVTAGTFGSNITGDWVFTLRSNGLEKAALIGFSVGSLLLLVSMREKRKRVGKVDLARDVVPFIVPVGAIVGGYMVYQHFFSDPQAKAREQALETDIATAEAVEPSRMSDSEISTVANALKEDLGYSYVSNNFTDAANQLTKPGTTADILRLIKAYGTHYITFFGIPTGKYTLEETVTRSLPKTYIDEVNAYYNAQGIDFNF